MPEIIMKLAILKLKRINILISKYNKKLSNWHLQKFNASNISIFKYKKLLCNKH